MSKEEESTVEATKTEVQEKTTNQVLFGDKYQNNGLPTVATEEPEVPENVEPEPVAEETPDDTKTHEPEYLNPEDFGDKVFKLNVGGEEVTVSAKDAIRRLQTDAYLTQKGQELAEERKQLDALKNSVVDKSTETRSTDNLDLGYEDESNPEVIALKKQLTEMDAKIGSLQQTVAPTVFDQDMKKVDAHLREKGFDDFMTFQPEIQNKFLNLSVEQQGMINLVDYVDEYQTMKIKSVLSEAEKKSSEPAENRQAPAVVNILGGSGTPSDSGEDIDEARLRKAHNKAIETGNWSEVYDIKGIFNQ